ncbi:MAG: hypothetical protein K2L23_05195 [Odoribacter sp.]|nr:hypothetical protein [Odoribacter sp.]
MDLTGKWRYFENYVQGVAEGELYLKQEGCLLSGRLVFTDRLKGEEPYMMQEFLIGRIDERKIRLEAIEYDIIHADFTVDYELDSWFGILVEDTVIKGASVDDQGVAGNFEFVKI